MAINGLRVLVSKSILGVNLFSSPPMPRNQSAPSTCSTTWHLCASNSAPSQSTRIRMPMLHVTCATETTEQIRKGGLLTYLPCQLRQWVSKASVRSGRGIANSDQDQVQDARMRAQDCRLSCGRAAIYSKEHEGASPRTLLGRIQRHSLGAPPNDFRTTDTPGPLFAKPWTSASSCVKSLAGNLPHRPNHGRWYHYPERLRIDVKCGRSARPHF